MGGKLLKFLVTVTSTEMWGIKWTEVALVKIVILVREREQCNYCNVEHQVSCYWV